MVHMQKVVEKSEMKTQLEKTGDKGYGEQS
jgi:hypothetical protein